MIICGGMTIDQKRRVVIIDGKEIPFHKKMKGHSIVQSNNSLKIDGYKLVDGKWKKPKLFGILF